jgi:hypothetical protein
MAGRVTGKATMNTVDWEKAIHRMELDMRSLRRYGRLTNAGLKQLNTTLQLQSILLAELAVKLRRTTRATKRQKRATDSLSRSTKRATGRNKGWWQSFGRVAIGFTIAYRAMNAFERGFWKLIEGFSYGIKKLDEFKVSIIQIAAALQNLSKEPPEKSFQMYMRFAEQSFLLMEKVAVKHLTTAADLQEAFAELALRGIVPAGEQQIEVMAQLVDKIFLATQGLQNLSGQIRTEVRALLEQTFSKGSVVARQARATIDNFMEKFDEISKMEDVQKKTEMFLTTLEPLLRGINASTEEVLKTHKAWFANLDMIFQKITRVGLSWMHTNILEYSQAISAALLDQKGLLSELGIQVAVKMADAWQVVFEGVLSILILLKEMYITLSAMGVDILAIAKGWVGVFKIIGTGLQQLRAGQKLLFKYLYPQFYYPGVALGWIKDEKKGMLGDLKDFHKTVVDTYDALLFDLGTLFVTPEERAKDIRKMMKKFEIEWVRFWESLKARGRDKDAETLKKRMVTEALRMKEATELARREASVYEKLISSKALSSTITWEEVKATLALGEATGKWLFSSKDAILKLATVTDKKKHLKGRVEQLNKAFKDLDTVIQDIFVDTFKRGEDSIYGLLMMEARLQMDTDVLNESRSLLNKTFKDITGLRAAQEAGADLLLTEEKMGNVLENIANIDRVLVFLDKLAASGRKGANAAYEQAENLRRLRAEMLAMQGVAEKLLLSDITLRRSKIEVEKEMLVLSQDFMLGATLGAKEFFEFIPTVAQRAHTEIKRVLTELNTGFSDFYYNMTIEGGNFLDNFKKMLENFLHSLSRAISNAMADQTSIWVKALVGSALGSIGSSTTTSTNYPTGGGPYDAPGPNTMGGTGGLPSNWNPESFIVVPKSSMGMSTRGLSGMKSSGKDNTPEVTIVNLLDSQEIVARGITKNKNVVLNPIIEDHGKRGITQRTFGGGRGRGGF